jgi:ribosomal protein S18 acetylase RimI-like enzyme
MAGTFPGKVLRIYAWMSRECGAFVYRRASASDAAEIAATVASCFETYRTFAPAGWEPPEEVSSTEPTRKRLGDDDVWALLARSAGDEPAGHISFSSSTTARWPERREELAHLWQLFVRERFWGSEVARTLHARAMAEAASQGYASMRLYTPAEQARARRFYEREGWVVRGEPIPSDLGFPVVEYRRALGGA